MRRADRLFQIVQLIRGRRLTTAGFLAQRMAVYAPPVGLAPEVQATLQTLREAAQAQRKVRVDYQDVGGHTTQRTVRPLGCFYWGAVWTLAAWCETRRDFRSFRLDRMQHLQVLEGAAGRFEDEAGHTLADYLRSAAPAGVPARLTQDS